MLHEVPLTVCMLQLIHYHCIYYFILFLCVCVCVREVFFVDSIVYVINSTIFLVAWIWLVLLPLFVFGYCKRFISLKDKSSSILIIDLYVVGTVHFFVYSNCSIMLI